MTISKSLQELLNGKTVASSRLNTDFVLELMSEGLLVSVVRGSRTSYRALDTNILKQYLHGKDESFRILDSHSDKATSRSSQAYATGNSKLISVRSCPGFPVNAYEPIECILNGQEFIIHPLEGSFIFVSDWQSFLVPTDVVVVGIENMENFRKIRQQYELFSSIFPNKRLLFVSRYPQSTDLRSWLETIPNQYTHFGDFDLASIHIFLSEFHKYLGNRASFLIPSDIEIRLMNGSFERYNVQYLKFKNLSTDIPSIQQLIDLINRFHRGYDQEGYINL